MRKTKAIKITAYALAGTLLAGALVFYNFIDKEKEVARETDFCPQFTVNTVYKTVDTAEGKAFAIAEDQSFVLSQHQGKVLVLNFWAPWCDPCRAEIPHFNELQENYPDEVEVVFINDGGETPEELLTNELNKKYKKNGSPYEKYWENYQYWLDYSCTFICPEKGVSVRAMFDTAGSLPVTVIVDEKGTIQKIHEDTYSYTQLEEEVLKYIR